LLILDLQRAAQNPYWGWFVKSSEFKRWLATQGATFSPGKGSHLKVELNGKISYLPMHHKDLKKGTLEGIKKQLGLK
jgi:mRNA interferase HicA